MDDKNFDETTPIRYVNEYRKLGDIFRFKRTGRKTYLDKLLLQTFVALIIIALLLLVNNINTMLTNSISQSVKQVLSWNVSLDNAVNTFKNFRTIIPNAKNTVGITEDDSTITFIMPIEGVITSPFGERIHPVFNTAKFHTGIDIDAEMGEPIKSSTNGIVKEVGEDEYNGKFVRIQSGSYEVIYAHCYKILAEKGQKVNQGDIIAEVGDTGITSGSHLHFEIQQNGVPINPMDMLDNGSIQ